MFEHIHAAICRLSLKKESACWMEFMYELKGCLDLKDKNETLLNGRPAQKSHDHFHHNDTTVLP